MNCANHADASAVAYCRTCGKALCANCTRPVKGVIYCENCLADRMAGVQPQQTVYQPATDPGSRIPPQPTGFGPSPGLAGVLAAIFPVRRRSSLLRAICKGTRAPGDSRHADRRRRRHEQRWTARAARDLAWIFLHLPDHRRGALGQSLSNGTACTRSVWIGQAFSTGDPVDSSKIPTGAVVLIGLGILFLLHTVGYSSLDLTASGRSF